MQKVQTQRSSKGILFPASESRDYSLSVRDTRVFTDNPKVKHCSGSKVPELSKKPAQVSSFSFYLKNGLTRCGKRKNLQAWRRDRQRARGGKSPPQYSFSCAMQNSISSITYREVLFNKKVWGIFTTQLLVIPLTEIHFIYAMTKII